MMSEQQTDCKQQKKELRTYLKARRALLHPEYCVESDAAILRRLKALESYQKAELIFCYVSMSGEVDTKQLIEDALREGKRVAVPRCESKGIMRAYEITGLDDLEPGVWGIGEPKQGCLCINPRELDLCIVPCVSCSSAGVRLGYGGGYYDRYLLGTEAVRVIFCREQLLCEEIPQEMHDCRMDVVITEKQTLRIYRENRKRI